VSPSVAGVAQGRESVPVAKDRVASVVGRESSEVRLYVLASSCGAEPDEAIDCTSLSGTTAHTDEWAGYRRVGERHGRAHRAVHHSGPKSARAPDLVGVRVLEVRCHTQQGLWTGPHDFLRPSRGMSKYYLAQYVASFQWGRNFKRVTDEFLLA
jgi:hypothetical protein